MRSPSEGSDIFLGDDDLELSKLPPEEYYRRYAEWLRAAQATNEQDKYDYSHGVFMLDKEPRIDSGDSAWLDLARRRDAELDEGLVEGRSHRGAMETPTEEMSAQVAVENAAGRGAVVCAAATEANVRFLREICEGVLDSPSKCEFWGKLADGRQWRVRCHKGNYDA